MDRESPADVACIARAMVFATLLVCGSSGVRAQVAVGDEFIVDAPPLEIRDHHPDVGVGGDGSIVFAWADTLDTGQIAARRYDASADPLGPAFRVDSGVFDAGSDIGGPGVAVDADGGFVVAWHAVTPHEVHGRRFAVSGAPVGDEFIADGSLTGLAMLSQPRAAAIFSDQFVLVWQSSASSDLHGLAVGRRIDPDGVPIGSGFQVNVANACDQTSVAAEANGDYVVAWCEGAQAFFARRFHAATGAGAPFEIAAGGAEGLNPIAISADDAGDFVAVWGSSGTVFARVFDAGDAPFGPAFTIGNSGNALHPAVAFDHDGDGFTAVWEKTIVENEDVDVVGRRFEPSGQPLGEEILVNTETRGVQFGPRIAATGDGFVVTWAGEPEIAAHPTIGIRARRFLADPAVDPIFHDGFD
ncbi:MAG TPA: hypothetical protein VFG55_04605 [Rhodanobacteraceae bacterium]|nr:hypothetical protein [Rhodanobacteraceae bacterium]